MSALQRISSFRADQGKIGENPYTVMPSRVSTGCCPFLLGTTAQTSTPRRTSSRPMVRVALPNPPYFPQAKISVLIKQIFIL
ncbi:MAG: hypothetical protein RBT16_14365 [Desulfococcus multivorans]|nr:hypothetical protein [Desulfococcus multivorans]